MKKLFLVRNLLLVNCVFGQEIQPKDIIEKYINAIGGREKIAEIKDIFLEMEGLVQGEKLNVVLQKKSPNKFLTRVTTESLGEINYTVFDGIKGSLKTPEQEQVIEGDAAKALMAQSEIIGEVLYLKDVTQLTYAGKENVEGVPCHILKVNTSMGEATEYYEVDSGLKRKQINVTETPMGTVNLSQEYSDYREVSGVKFPFKTVQDMGMVLFDMKVKSLKININPSDELFSVK
jgi:zinc protease